jgi:hypothetical protein
MAVEWADLSDGAMKAVGGAAALIGAWLGLAKWQSKKREALDARFAGKADKTVLDAAWSEIEKRRAIEAKLFDQLREHELSDNARFERTENANRDRHDELMAVIGDLRADIAGRK